MPKQYSKIATLVSFMILVPSLAWGLTNHGNYFPHGWMKPDLFGSMKIGDVMIDFDPSVDGEETRREEFVLANDAGRAIRLSHNGRSFCFVVDIDLDDPWTYQVVDYDGSGAFEMKEPPFSDFPLPQWTFVNYPFLTLRTADYTLEEPNVNELISALAGVENRPCIKKFTPEQRAALAIARGGEMPPDECLPEPYSPVSGLDDSPRVALNILFEFDKDVLTSQAQKTLNTLGRAMMSPQLAGSSFRLEGHTDAAGPFDYNQDLSQRRVHAVQRYLLENFDLNPSQLFPIGLGESRPLPNLDPLDGRNRRVEIVNTSPASVAANY